MHGAGRAVLSGVAMVIAALAGRNGAMAAEIDEAVMGVFAPHPIVGGTGVAVVCDVYGEIMGVRWYNNDSLSMLTSIRLYDAGAVDEVGRGELLYEAMSVRGHDDAWSEIVFSGPVTSERGRVCIVLELAAERPFSGRGRDGGSALGYWNECGEGTGYVMRDDMVLAKLRGSPAVKPILSNAAKAADGRMGDGRPGPGARRLFVEAWPNPAQGGTELHYALPRGEVHDLAIYDLRGRVVRRLADGPAEAGVYTRRWDGGDEEGAPVAAGIYFAKLRAGADVKSRRIVMMR